MEIRYTRKLTASCMRLTELQKMLAWEQKMIVHAPVEGILFAESVWEDGQCELWYDITGKQSLETILENEMLGYELLRRLLAGIYEASQRLEGILLDADALLLLPETIFWNSRTEELCFCYYPGNPVAVSEAFAAFMEELLIKLAHDDDRAVELAYSVYESAVGGRLTLKELRELIGMDGRRGEREQSKSEVHTEYGEDDGQEETGAGDIEPTGKRVGQQADVFGKIRLTERFLRWLHETSLQERLQWILPRSKKEEGEMEGFVFEPEPEEEKVPVRPTVLLTELSGSLEGILRYEGKGSGGDLVINKLPYTIGSGEDCDGYLPSATVSRRHARITQKEGIYFMEDLNSSNGTYVDGRLLDYRTKVCLKKNETVVFADEKFRFI